MGKFKFIETGIEGLTIVEPTVFGDDRGYFMETYSEREFADAGLPTCFVQDNKRQFYVPEGFAHGFSVLSQEAVFAYKCTALYDPTDEGGIMYNDPQLNIDWQIPEGVEVLLSEKDKKHPGLDAWR